MGPLAPVTSTISDHASRGPVLIATSGTSLRQGPEERLPESPKLLSEAHLLPHRLTGAAVQLSWELRTGRGRRTTSTEVHFGQLEVLECLWPRGASEPEYTEVKAKGECVQSGLEVRLGMGARPDLVNLLFPIPDPELPQHPGLPGLGSALCPPAPHTDPAPCAQGNQPHSRPQGPWLFPMVC